MNPLSRRVECNDKALPGLRPILETWCEFNLAYVDRHEGTDIPWHYCERTFIGFLTAAAWKNRAVALEEWPTQKSSGNGRCDLYILPEGVNHGHGWICEAKLCKVDLSEGKEDKGLQQVNESLKDAIADANKLQGAVTELALGISFIQFILRSPERRREAADAAIENWIDRLRTDKSAPKYDAYAHLFPWSIRNGLIGPP